MLNNIVPPTVLADLRIYTYTCIDIVLPYNSKLLAYLAKVYIGV